MRVEVMQYYGLIQRFNMWRLKWIDFQDSCCGVVGSSKTVTLRRLQQILKDEKKYSIKLISCKY